MRRLIAAGRAAPSTGAGKGKGAGISPRLDLGLATKEFATGCTRGGGGAVTRCSKRRARIHASHLKQIKIEWRSIARNGAVDP